MAGSRLPRSGSIFARVSGLLRAGAMKEADKPLWYDIYAAFPPRQTPASQQTVRDVLYKEDILRAKFYKEFGNQETVDMTTEEGSTVCSSFIDTYHDLEKNSKIPEDRLWSATCKTVRMSGVKLKSIEEMKQEAARVRAERESKADVTNNSKEGT